MSDPYAPPEARLDESADTRSDRYRSRFLAGFLGNMFLFVVLSIFLQGRFLAYVQDLDFFLLSLGLCSLIGAALVVPIRKKSPKGALYAAPFASLAVLSLMYGLDRLFLH